MFCVFLTFLVLLRPNIFYFGLATPSPPQPPERTNPTATEYSRIERDALDMLYNDIAYHPFSPDRLNPDMWISCDGSLPPSELFPPTNPRENYADMYRLCSYIGLFGFGQRFQSQNMGCACRNPGLHEFVYCFPPPISDPVLWYNMNLLRACEKACRCIKKPEPIDLTSNPIYRSHNTVVGLLDDRLYVHRTLGPTQQITKFYQLGTSKGHGREHERHRERKGLQKPERPRASARMASIMIPSCRTRPPGKRSGFSWDGATCDQLLSGSSGP